MCLLNRRDHGFCFSTVTDATNVPPHYPQIQEHVHAYTQDLRLPHIHSFKYLNLHKPADTQPHPDMENNTEEFVKGQWSDIFTFDH